MKQIEYENINYLIGENAQDNWDTFKKSKQNWIWFHLNNLASPYVILCENIKKINKSDILNYIQYGCELCKENSKYKNQKVQVIWTECKNISLGSNIGEAIVKGKTNKMTI